MWMELYSRDPALLEQFEGFLTNVVTDLERSQSDVEHVQNKIKKLVRLQLNNIYSHCSNSLQYAFTNVLMIL